MKPTINETDKTIAQEHPIKKNIPLSLTQKFQKWQKRWMSYFSVSSRFFPLLRKQAGKLLLSLLFGTGVIIAGLLEPWPIKLIFDNVLGLKPKHLAPDFFSSAVEHLSSRPLVLLNWLIAAIIGLAILKGIFYYFQQILIAHAGQSIAAGIRLALYTHLQRLSFSFHDRRRTGDLIMRLTNDIRVLRDILITFPLSFTSEFLLTTGMLIVMFWMDWQLSLIAALVLPVLITINNIYQKPMKNAARQQREKEGNLATMAAEVLGAVKIVQGFRRENYEINRFQTENKSSMRTGFKATRLEAKMRWATGLALAIATAVVLSFASRRVLMHQLSPGDLLVFVAYLQAFYRPLRRMSTMTERLARGTAAGERVLEMLNTKEMVKDRKGAIKAQNLKGDIQYKFVSFAYSKDKPLILNKINFKIQAGERVALIGPTGCGKSTVISLLPRFYSPQKGHILIDGCDIRDYSVDSLRDQISLVFQEPILFATTIAENIRYGKQEATMDEIIQAAQAAEIHNIITSLPDAYQTVLGERGGTLSGGQRQCIAIARAMIKDAPIVLLDEPTTGLDQPNALLVMRALHKLMANKTVIMISHHYDILQDATRVLVMGQGEILEEKEASEWLSRADHHAGLQHFKINQEAS